MDRRIIDGCKMGHGDDVLAAISRIHAAGLDTERWPDALSHITILIGGHGASLETLERPSLRHSSMYSYGLHAIGSYLEHYAPLSPRLPDAARRATGTVLYDAQYIDEKAMDAHPFYMEFLASFDMRYCIGGVIAASDRELSFIGIQRSRKQGHATPAKIKLMDLLLPHLQQATDVIRRLGKLSNVQRAFERTLDWLADGVLMLADDGAVRYANVAAQEIIRANDGIAMRRGAVEFVSGAAMAKFGAALKALGRLRDADPAGKMQSDFIVERGSGAPPYSVSVRPLLAQPSGPDDSVALVFIHDPLARNATALDLLRQAFGLTPSGSRHGKCTAAGVFA
ncbi:MAG: hypothetical protein ACXWJT_13055 [Xanthobacteraceae bacterium]